MRIFTKIILATSILVSLSGCKGEPPIAKANKEKILIVGNSNEPKGLDPHLVSGVLEGNILRAIFEGLCVDHPSKDGAALPGAAERWEANDDFTIWTFHLRKDGKWSDGTPLTAEDFVFSYHRLLHPDLAAKYSELLYFLKNADHYNKNDRCHILFSNDAAFDWSLLKTANLKGDPNAKADTSKSFSELNSSEIKSWIAAKGLDSLGKNALEAILADASLFDWPSNIPSATRTAVLKRLHEHAETDLFDLAQVGVQAVDDYTLRFTLRAPTPFLPEITKHYTWFPTPKHCILKYGKIADRFTPWTDPGNLVSNGPFMLTKWVFNHHIDISKNPNYWDADTVKLNGIRYLPTSNTYTETRMFLDGQMHITDSLAPEMVPYAEKNLKQFHRQEPYVGVRFIRLNITKKPLNDPRVRHALSLAVDRKLIIENLLQGGQIPASAITPPNGDYQPPAIATFDPVKARKLLAEAGFPDGKGFPELKILTTDRETALAEAEAYLSMWKEHLGINVRIEQREWSSYLKAQNDLAYDIAPSGWIGDYLDPTTFLEMWSTGNGNNCTGFSNVAFEQALKDAALISDPKARLLKLAEAEKTVLEAMPVIPFYWYTKNYLIQPNVKNWHPLLLSNHPYKFVDLAPAP